MATLAMMAGGALVNALAFSGSNFIFGQLGDHGKAEMQRHNLAMEKLSKAREDWNRDRQQTCGNDDGPASFQRRGRDARPAHPGLPESAG